MPVVRRRLASIVVVSAVFMASCGDTGDSGPATRPDPTAPPPTGDVSMPVEPVVIIDDLEVPWGLAFLPGGEVAVTERDGRLSLLSGDGSTERVTVDVPGVDAQGEGGLLGITPSPSYGSDRWLYAYLTTSSDNRVMRFRVGPDRQSVVDMEVIVEGIDSARVHNGGRIAFGPDGMLYVATGDAGDRQASQDTTDLNGKILRMTPEGDPAPGNPTPDSLVYSYGHRNVQGLAWDSRDRLFATEFGQDAFDEVNIIQAGGNYGWPIVEGNGDTQGGRFINPVVTWATDEASPSGIAFVGEPGGSALYVAALRGERLWRIPFDDDGEVGAPQSTVAADHGRHRTVALAPDDSLWVMTSNADGRGDGTPDRIVRFPSGSLPQ